MRISLLQISLLRFFKTITKIWLMQFYRLFILQYRIHNRKKLFGNYTTFIWKINEGQKNYNCYCATGISVISYPLRSLTKANQKDIKKRSVSTLKGDTHNVSTTPLWQGGFRQYLPFSWTTLRGKHCQHPIAVMGVVDTIGQCLQLNSGPPQNLHKTEFWYNTELLPTGGSEVRLPFSCEH